ncbi:MAG: hypothetical protein PGN34_19405 [Methylobacterium frigidaeris]
MRASLFLAALLAAPFPVHAAGGAGTITVRTENFPRPPYSGATYYIYERGGQTICTKLETCNKFNQCDTQYKQGTYKDPEDVETGQPFGTTPAVAIAPASLAKHVCLTRFGLTGGR